MYNPTRDQARQFFIDAWAKHRQGSVLTTLETIAADLVAEHPEYHALLEDPEGVHKDFAVEDGQINPFLHLSLHLAIHEQLGINQPPGLREAYDARLARHGQVQRRDFQEAQLKQSQLGDATRPPGAVIGQWFFK